MEHPLTHSLKLQDHLAIDVCAQNTPTLCRPNIREVFGGSRSHTPVRKNWWKGAHNEKHQGANANGAYFDVQSWKTILIGTAEENLGAQVPLIWLTTAPFSYATAPSLLGAFASVLCEESRGLSSLVLDQTWFPTEKKCSVDGQNLFGG